MAKRGRPPKLTRPRQDEFCELVHRGLSHSAAARSLGCSPSTVTRLLQRDKWFRARVERIEQVRERQRLARLVVLSRPVDRDGAEQLADLRRERVKPTPASRRRDHELDLVLRQFVMAHLNGDFDVD
jgi:IS30 family transposase